MRAVPGQSCYLMALHSNGMEWNGMHQGDARTQYQGVPADRSTTLGDEGIVRSSHYKILASSATTTAGSASASWSDEGRAGGSAERGRGGRVGADEF